MIRSLRATLFSHSAWIVALTFVFVGLDFTSASLFGLEPNEKFSSLLGFSPSEPLRHSGLNLVSYPLVHASWAHWLSSMLLWLYLAPLVETRLVARMNARMTARLNSRQQSQKAGLVILYTVFYVAIAGGIALTYSLPWAPSASQQDRLLGMSAVLLFQFGFLIFLKPSLFYWFLLPTVLYFSFFQNSVSPESVLTTWGHGAGFIIGLIAGYFFRFALRPST